MNKTLTVNIGGIVFNIEEHAYENLRKYLGAIKSYFTTSEGRDEIMQDIEARIAEMLQERIRESKQVIEEADVTAIINAMGRPEQFAGEEPTAEEKKVYEEFAGKSYRRLYRDPDDKVVAGVCSGLSYRLGIDPIWLRILFIISPFLSFGTAIIIYIILIIILPKAITPAQKLEMRGENVTISNIRKSMDEEASSVTDKKAPGFFSRFFDGLGDVIKGILKAILFIVGAFFAFIALVVLFALVVALLAVMGVAGISIPIFISDIFLSSSQQFWAMVSLFLVSGVPVIMLLYSGIKLLFRIDHKNRTFKMVMMGLWIAGFVIAFATGTFIAREFTTENRIRREMPLAAANTDTMFIDLMNDPQYEEDKHHNLGIFSGTNYSVVSGEEINMSPDAVELDIQKAAGDKFELVRVISARGRTAKDALENTEKINYNFEQKDSLLMFSEYFPIPKGVKYRAQEIKLILKVPVGKNVHFNERSRHIIYDIDNVTNTWDGDMIGKTWTMTASGLECLNCKFSDSIDEQPDFAKIHIGKNGVQIDASDDDDSVNIEGKDVKIHINEDGVHIDAKGKKKHR